jgi:hypothetical protein
MIPCLLQHQDYMCQLNSRNLKFYCNYSYSLPVTKTTVYPQSSAPLSLLNFPPPFSFSSSTSFLQWPCSPTWALTSSILRLKTFLSSADFLQFLHFNVLLASLSAACKHLLLRPTTWSSPFYISFQYFLGHTLSFSSNDSPVGVFSI